ncbi:MAG: plastocyanin [Hydrogenophilales bacterium RIFOXYD1_FULL_62_11]|nr:MAG: plastocyanin [Hydrogenophilales bacterium RIFOXYD1_FULL_62_11]
MKPSLLLIALLAAPLAHVPAHAHGEKKHVAAAPAAAEQTAWGIAGTPAQATRTVTLDMTDAMRFSPDTLTVQAGETVRFVVRNTGRMLHEMVIGTPDELAKHAAMMAQFPNMEHDEAYMVHVDPGKTGEIVWHFNRAGSFEFACLIAGHFEAGMRGTLTVTPKQGAAK